MPDDKTTPESGAGANAGGSATPHVPTPEEWASTKAQLAATLEANARLSAKEKKLADEQKRLADEKAIADGNAKGLIAEKDKELESYKAKETARMEKVKASLEVFTKGWTDDDKALIPQGLDPEATLEYAQRLHARLQASRGGPPANIVGARSTGGKEVSDMNTEEFNAYVQALLNEKAKRESAGH